MPDNAFPQPTLEPALDRQALAQLEKRFRELNASRLLRTRSALGARQQIFLDLLPLLFHVNHPMLPGYVTRGTPAGVCHFEPSRQDMELGRSIARSFAVQRDPSRGRDIEALFLMGSVGTVAHSEQSDLDVWICYTPAMPAEAVAELNRKCQLIAAWGQELRLEVHFFLMDCEAFKRGQLSALNTESSGSAQRLLLLDEFYRTAVHLAGRMPLWWFVPRGAERDYATYAHTLLHRRFIEPAAVLDFGGVAAIPDGEFLGAGVWQLYKAIESPYKSVLKLLLLEAYASQHPHIEPLALEFKQKVYDGQVDVNELDSYVMIYRRIETYLSERKQWRRLELARRCLYFKINKPLSRALTGRSKSWQRQVLEELTEQWSWTRSQLQLLDQRPRWKAHQVLEERSLLVNELNHSYRFLTEFANASGATRTISGEELTVLGRKLQAAFERRPGKIEAINPGISGDLSEPRLIISQSVREEGLRWTARAPDAPLEQPFRQTSSLVELVLWCLYNGIIDSATQFDLSDTDIDQGLMRRLINSLQHWLPSSSHALPHNRFQTGATPSKVLLLINVCSELGTQQDHNVMASNRADALVYSAVKANLVRSIDFVMCNSWGEISCFRFEGEMALLQAVEEFLRLSLPGSQQVPPQLEVDCLGTSHAVSISHRVRELLGSISACYYGSPAAPTQPGNTRYLFTMGGSFYSLQFRGARLVIDKHNNENALLRWLGQDQPSYSPLVVDAYAVTRHPLALISRHSQLGRVTVFFQSLRTGLRLYVVDECGSLLSFSSHNQGLVPLHRFLRAIIQRQARAGDAPWQTLDRPIHFFQIQPASIEERDQPLVARAVHIANELRPGAAIDVKAVVSCDSRGHYGYSFYCDQQEFSQLDHGARLFEITAAYIRSRRAGENNYPVYLSDLDLDLCRRQLSREGKLQVSHYLRLKLELEQSLNKAMPA